MADTEGFEEFYTATVGRLLGQLFPVTGDLHEAEEVVQEAFARASTHWSRLRDYEVPEPGCGGWPSTWPPTEAAAAGVGHHPADGRPRPW